MNELQLRRIFLKLHVDFKNKQLKQTLIIRILVTFDILNMNAIKVVKLVIDG